MVKPATADGYSAEVTQGCERVLVTLLRGLGPWRESIFLIGGLVPRYLVGREPPDVPAHAGTGDLDVVVQLHVLSETDAYHTLEENFQRIGFERAVGAKGAPVSWRWQIKTDSRTKIILELLADDPERSGGRVAELPTKGNISALNIPHSSMVFDHHKSREIRAELLGENGVATAVLRYANIVTFVCLKAFAFDHRTERKDAHDLTYCIAYQEGGPELAAEEFRSALDGPHRKVIHKALALLHRDFGDDESTPGYLKPGPVAVAKFEVGEDAELREQRTLKQRQTSELVSQFLLKVGLTSDCDA